MEQLGQYLLSISAAAIICAILQRLVVGKGGISTITKMLCGIFLLCTIGKPFLSISISDLGDFSYDFRKEAMQSVAYGQALGNNALQEIISDRVSAYILDKAKTFDAMLDVEVYLSEDTVPVPTGVRICGEISPYGKTQLQQIISQDLGIAKENQLWT